MNDKQVEMLQALAVKLGTTVEYLWAVLIRQATVNAITDIIQYGLLALAVYVYVRWVRSDKRDLDNGGDSWPPALILGVPLMLVAVVAFFSFPNTITALVNPEYWALNRVLSSVKH